MRVLCDVHIPYRLVNFLRERGVDATHVNRILNKWYTRDSEIARYAISEWILSFWSLLVGWAERSEAQHPNLLLGNATLLPNLRLGSLVDRLVSAY